MRKLVLVSILAFMVCITCGCKPNTDTASGGSESGGGSSAIAVAEVSSKAQTSSEESESKDTASKDTASKGTVSKDVSSKENSSIQVQSPNRPSNNSSSQTASEAPATESQPTATTNSSTTEKKDWFDESLLTYTQADVGKVVGYSSLINQDITIVSVIEGTTADGRKCIETTYSFGPITSIVECQYCHKFPCPDGGGKDCSKYNVKEDATVTCPRCGKPRGDGYNGTCHGLIDWENGGKASCNYYD